MRTLRRFFKRLTSFANTRRDEGRLSAEIEEHLALQTEENLKAGLPPAEARRQAVFKFGAVESIKESYREQRGLPLLESLIQDTRYALRRLRMAPAFTATAILTLSLGIGATTSIFTLAHAVLLKSLPVSHPGELYRVGQESHCCYLAGYSQDGGFSLVSYDLYRYLKDNTRSFTELAAVPSVAATFGVRRAGASEAAQAYPGEFVSGNYFTTLGVNPCAGRGLTPDDDRPGAPPVAVMSYRLWQQRYAADPSVVGGIFTFNEKPFTIVGISPPGFFGAALRSTSPDFFLPLNTEPFVQSDSDLNKYDTHWLNLIGRLRPEASPVSAEAEMRVALRQWLRAHWGEMNAGDRAKFPQQTLFLSPGGAGINSMRDQYERWLQILMAVTGFVLLIVCANIANLMLVRGMERRRHTALSIALGAGTSRLVAASLIECVLLSLAGGAAGLAVAYAGTRLILRFAFPSPPGLGAIPIDPSPSLPVLLFALAIALATGVAFGIAPAWISARVDPIEALRSGGRITDHGSLVPRKALVVLQTAVSLILLSAAGLLTTVLQRLASHDLGFEPANRLVATINPRLAGYRASQLPALYTSIRSSIAGEPGVASVALCLYSPPGGGWGSGVAIDGRPGAVPAADSFAVWNRVGAGYFDVVGTRVVRGRGLSEEDTAASRKVAVVNQAFARKFFGNDDPIASLFGRGPDTSREFEIVGVVENARYWPYSLDRPRPMFFIPEAQADYGQSNLGSLFLRDIVIAIKPGAGVSAPVIRQALASVAPDLPVLSIRTMNEAVDQQLIQQRLIARITSLFAVLSLILASIGVYGVIAYNASRRSTEIGVRIALGATRRDVIRLIVQGAFGLFLIGLLIGLPVMFVLNRLLGSQLYGMPPYNPFVTLMAVLALGVSVVASSLIPALRASFAPPAGALRSE